MELRPYTQACCDDLARLFYDTVHRVNAVHYTQEQLAAWAPGIPDGVQWNNSFLAHSTLVAWQDGKVVGFADMDDTGYLDRLYVHADHQRQGIATALCDALEAQLPGYTFTTHASITARPFFENRGYVVLREQQVQRRGVWLTNYVMQKTCIP